MEATSASGRTVLVTGATSGIGLETARELSRAGARVLVGARDASRGRTVVEELIRAGGSAALFEADLASFASVRRAAGEIFSSPGRLDVLVNNAGLAARRRRTTADGHELTWQVNFLSAFLLTRLLLPLLREAEAPRVVNVSSEAHRSGRIAWDDLERSRGYRTLAAYGQSKLALVLFTRELARREPRIAVNAVHPGVISTNIWRAAPRFLEGILKAILPSARRGARPVARLAVSPELEGITGRYFDRFRETAPAPAARNEADAARLWEVAEAATSN